MGFGDYGGKGMRCVHGVEMAVQCNACVMEAGSDRIVQISDARFKYSEHKETPRAEDRLATELASLTRSIQGLSGNVAKLVEERPKITRGPVTDAEVVFAMNNNGCGIADIEEAKKHFPCTFEETKSSLEYFAKSRGLID